MGQKNILWGRLSLLRMANYLKIIKPSGHTEKAAKCDSPPLKIILFLSSFRSREEIIERRCRRTIFSIFAPSRFDILQQHIGPTYLHLCITLSISMYLSYHLSLCIYLTLSLSLLLHVSHSLSLTPSFHIFLSLNTFSLLPISLSQYNY